MVSQIIAIADFFDALRTERSYRKALEVPVIKGMLKEASGREFNPILVDNFLRPSAQISLPFPGVEPVLRIAKAQTIRGWQSAWGLPKPDDEGLAMGSVYLFRFSGTGVDNPDDLKNFLAGVSTGGIGLRREEGFGQVSVVKGGADISMAGRKVRLGMHK